MATRKIAERPAFVIDASTGDLIKTTKTAVQILRLMREMSEGERARLVLAIRAIADGSWPYSMEETKALSGEQARAALHALAPRSRQ
jgi:hypothetical protein